MANRNDRARRDLIVIGTSAGGVEALKRLVRDLPDDLPAAVLVVLHVAPEGPSLLPQILTAAGRLPAIHPHDREGLEYGRIYCAPPDMHLIVESGVVRVLRGPKENRHRPSVDPLFRSAAAIYGPRVIACVLTGCMDDGTAGAISVRRHRGTIIVQDPGDAANPGMPSSVLENAGADYVLPLDEIAPALVRLVGRPSDKVVEAPFEVARADVNEVRFAEVDMDAIENLEPRGKPSAFACPECNGSLREVEDEGLLRFRCRVGHALTAKTLSVEQSARLEDALWTAFRALEEAAALHRRMAARAQDRGHLRVAAEHEAAADTQEDSARTLRQLIMKPRPEAESAEAEVAET
jgi:two-component system chemotaxis response regulator CheB